MLESGKGAVLVKADIKKAYRMLPIDPDNQNLLGVQWEGEYFTDRALPFGLRSAPKIFSAVADALQWILTNKGFKICFTTLTTSYLYASQGKTLLLTNRFYWTPSLSWEFP